MQMKSFGAEPVPQVPSDDKSLAILKVIKFYEDRKLAILLIFSTFKAPK